MTSNIGKQIAIICNLEDQVNVNPQIDWAVEQLKETLESKWFHVNLSNEIVEDEGTVFTVVVGNLNDNSLDPHPPVEAESIVINPVKINDNPGLVITGADSRAIVYGLLEVCDCIKHAEDPLLELENFLPVNEKPANTIRSVKRLFVNEHTDKLWFYNKDFWREYLTELATHRFNRFSLALGMGYDNGHDPDIKDFYFCFAYPFLVSVPGYNVYVEGLSIEERNKNLNMLRFIGQEANRRGIEFHLGLWTHTYEPEESPDLRYRINGVNDDNHATYCRDAIKTLLEECPEIDGLTIRVHYESGIPEPAHLFWKVVLKGVALSDRTINLDLHPKGIDDELLQVAEENGVPFTISPKFWAEHMALPYHQAAIRETELPVDPTPEAGKMIITTTSRRFTRYGYADFLKEDRNYEMFFRIWPGTQRVLLWGDPEIAAGYGRAGSFCGSKGIELMEPLSFKSRKTSETPSGRDPYIDPALRLGINDWKKYRYSYRLWGRLLYNPDANQETWQRYLRNEFAKAAEASENSLKYASKILPLITLAHMPSVANNHYWPEIYSNIFIIDTDGKPEYHCDGRHPDTFNVASPLDPELFYRIDEFTEDMMNNQKSSKISPIETAAILEDLAKSAKQNLVKANELIKDKRDPSFRRLAIDVEVQIHMGLFFANKFRAATAYAFYEKVGAKELLDKALFYYRKARDEYEKIADVTRSIYTNDITFGYVPYMRGHWTDRIEGIEEDMKRMEKQTQFIITEPSTEALERATVWLNGKSKAKEISVEHTPPLIFQRGDDVSIALQLHGTDQGKVTMKYRRVNQAEGYKSVTMERKGNEFTSTIPSSYTDSLYPLVYYFEVEDDRNEKRQYPGFENTLSNQPYFVIRQSM
ncbi:hypothetical protein J2S74_000693 [Evansella vedderi]|uniref:Alpha glucuronidase N-terminal domain-containing protein n=1 Tax=Evansella vedderi TaxID=38282 RepID=A0ABT9ZQ07_9BACI|nr:hypothetical protein [Evansella vedderi]MDQ0253321.1 hypothetical protein [Evansella vedderi]